MGLLQDGTNSAIRYVVNNFQDHRCVKRNRHASPCVMDTMRGFHPRSFRVICCINELQREEAKYAKSFSRPTRFIWGGSLPLLFCTSWCRRVCPAWWSAVLSLAAFPTEGRRLRAYVGG